MMLYQITISKAGFIQNIAYVEAEDALTAIDRVEAVYEQKQLYISGKDGRCQRVVWTGYEFEARRLPDKQHILYFTAPEIEPRLLSVVQ